MKGGDTGFVGGSGTYLIRCYEVDDFSVTSCQFNMGPSAETIAMLVNDSTRDVVLG